MADLLYSNDVTFIMRLWSDKGQPAICTGGQLLTVEVIWEQLVELYPPYRDYQQKTQREIPVVVLEKQPPSQ